MASPSLERRILLADDEVMILHLVGSLLEMEGYQVLSAENGKAAVELARGERNVIDLFMSDLEMPEMDGLSAYRRIKQARPNLKVLFMSGGGIFGQLRLPPSLPFLKKPFGLQALRNKLAGILNDGLPAEETWPRVILVVDRDSSRRERTAAILTENGFAVLATISLEEAEEISYTISAIDLIITEAESGAAASNHKDQALAICRFDRDVLKRNFLSAHGEEFLPNEPTPELLIERVNKLLASSAG